MSICTKHHIQLIGLKYFYYFSKLSFRAFKILHIGLKRINSECFGFLCIAQKVKLDYQINAKHSMFSISSSNTKNTNSWIYALKAFSFKPFGSIASIFIHLKSMTSAGNFWIVGYFHRGTEKNQFSARKIRISCSKPWADKNVKVPLFNWPCH